MYLRGGAGFYFKFSRGDLFILFYFIYAGEFNSHRGVCGARARSITRGSLRGVICSRGFLYAQARGSLVSRGSLICARFYLTHGPQGILLCGGADGLVYCEKRAMRGTLLLCAGSTVLLRAMISLSSFLNKYNKN
jgi:hypothetical protein